MIARELLVYLNGIAGIGPVTIRMLETWTGDRTCSTLHELCEIVQTCAGPSRVQAQVVALLRAEQEKPAGERTAELDRAAAHGVTVVTWHDAQYPALVRALYAPPPVLYVRGVLPTAPCLAIVGSREANRYGLQVVDAYVPSLVSDGWVVVSGGARGIDARAHSVAMQAGGTTAVLLGSGLLEIYPREHAKLFDQVVAQGGALVSTFSLRTKPTPHNFPLRNRVIAGMSLGVLVVQAAAQSGALITAMSAVREGRDVAVVPGSIFDPLSAGVHRLLREGATPVSSIESLVEWVRTLYTPPSHVRLAQENLLQGQPSQTKSVQLELSEDPLVLYCGKQARSCEEIAEAQGCELSVVYERLWQLQVAGKIEQTASGRWIRC